MLSVGFVPALAGIGGIAAVATSTGVFHPNLQAMYIGPKLGSAGYPGSCGVLHCYTPQEIQGAYNYNPAYAAVGG